MAANAKNQAILAASVVGGATGAYFLIAGSISLAHFLTAPSLFTGQTVAIDGLIYRPISTVTAQLKRLSIEGANMSAAEAVATFSAGQGSASAREAFGKLTAEKIMTTEIQLAIPGGSLMLRDLDITHVRNGMATQMRIGGGEWTMKGAGTDAAFKIGALTLTDVDVGYVFGALKSGGGKGEMFRYHTLNWDGMKGEMTLPSPQGGEHAVIEVGEVQGVNTYEGSLPVRAGFAIGGVRFTPASGTLGSGLMSIGLETLDVSAIIKASYDWSARRMIVEEASLTIADLGALSVKGNFGNLDKGVLAADQETRAVALAGMTMESATLRFTNSGIVDKMLELAAKLTSQPVEAVKAMAIAAAGKSLLGGKGRIEDGPVMAAFIKDPRNLTISLRPKAGTMPISFDKMNGQFRDMNRFEMEMRSND